MSFFVITCYNVFNVWPNNSSSSSVAQEMPKGWAALEAFTFQKEVGSWRFPPDDMVLCREWGVSEFLCLFYPFLCRYFLSHLMCRVTQLVSGFLSEGIVPCVAVHSQHPLEGQATKTQIWSSISTSF